MNRKLNTQETDQVSESYVFLEMKKDLFWTKNFAIVISFIYIESEKKFETV